MIGLLGELAYPFMLDGPIVKSSARDAAQPVSCERNLYILSQGRDVNPTIMSLAAAAHAPSPGGRSVCGMIDNDVRISVLYQGATFSQRHSVRVAPTTSPCRQDTSQLGEHYSLEVERSL